MDSLPRQSGRTTQSSAKVQPRYPKVTNCGAMIPCTKLPCTNINLPRLIFGTASLFNAGSQSERLALLEAAVCTGFTHFDTAPYYGFGWAERDLGELVKRHPHVTITTKVGIYSPGGENASRAAVFARKAMGKLLPALSKPSIDFEVKRAKAALRGSLQRLKTENISLYLLHEPRLELLRTDEWQQWLADEKKLGVISDFGLALPKSHLLPFLDAKTDLAPVIQLLDTLEDKEADCLAPYDRPIQITFGYVSAAQKRGQGMPVTDILRAALARNEAGAIIVSTTKQERLAQYPALFKDAR